MDAYYNVQANIEDSEYIGVNTINVVYTRIGKLITITLHGPLTVMEGGHYRIDPGKEIINDIYDQCGYEYDFYIGIIVDNIDYSADGKSNNGGKIRTININRDGFVLSGMVKRDTIWTSSVSFNV